MNFKKLIQDILTNEDNISFSSKKVGGYISLLATLAYVFVSKAPDNGITITLAGMTLAFFGLTSLDFKSALPLKEANSTSNP